MQVELTLGRLDAALQQLDEGVLRVLLLQGNGRPTHFDRRVVFVLNNGRSRRNDYHLLNQRNFVCPDVKLTFLFKMHVTSERTYLRLATTTAAAVAGIFKYSVQRGSKELIHGGPDSQEETLSGRRLYCCICSLLVLFVF